MTSPLPASRSLEVVFVLASTQNAFFFELAGLLGHELEVLGTRCSIAQDGFPDFGSQRVYVVLPPHEYSALRPHDPALGDPVLLQRTIGICTEQPGTSFFDDNLQIIGRLGRTFDISRVSLAALRGKGFECDHLQLGYTPLLDVFDPDAKRDIDVAFIGCQSGRRDHLMGALGPVLARYNCHLAFSDNSRPNGLGAPAPTLLWGDAKRNVLARTKILLNIHQGETPYFEWLRAVEAISAGAVLITETSVGMAPLVSGRHLIACRPESLGPLVHAVLADESMQRRVREEAYRFLVRHVPMRAAAEKLLIAASRLAARPCRGARPMAGLVRKTEVPASLCKPGDATVRDELREFGGSAVNAAIKRMAHDLMDIRRSVQPGVGARPSGLVHRTSAHQLLDRADISTVTALYNQAGFVHRALDSLALAATPATELVIVDDGSTDGSFDVALRWLRAHEHVPAVLVTHGRNRGLGVARNTAIEFARGNFVFVLDSDNQVLPRCLELLVQALRDDSGASFAYPLIARVDALGKTALHPPFGWEPDRLVHGNYIDALALIRSDALRKLGGYTTDRRLYGWEDYDLWCRMAACDMRGVLVGSVLAKYRDSPTSMRKLTDIDETDARVAIAERSPTLFTRGRAVGT
jgi:hypothetical protein